MAIFDRMKEGFAKSRERFKESMNMLFYLGPDIDEDFWDTLEEVLITSDMGASASIQIVDELREDAIRKGLKNGREVIAFLDEKIAAMFAQAPDEGLSESPLCVLFVGINGSGKTTTCGKLASEAKSKGRCVTLGAGDTFRAAAIEQLEEWARRSNTPIISTKRGADPASVCFETIEAAEQNGSDLVLIDTAGRLHTSDDLMRELQKVCNVVKKRSPFPVKTVLVIDATTGQNGLVQAKRFNDELTLDGVIITKLDGTAKGGIAVAISHELGLPILKIGVGEGIDDLQDFDALGYAHALTGEMDKE